MKKIKERLLDQNTSSLLKIGLILLIFLAVGILGVVLLALLSELGFFELGIIDYLTFLSFILIGFGMIIFFRIKDLRKGSMLLTISLIIAVILGIYHLVQIGQLVLLLLGWIPMTDMAFEFGMITTFGILAFPVESLIEPTHQLLVYLYTSIYSFPIYIGAIYVVWQLRKIFVNLNRYNELFTGQNELRFKKIGYAVSIIFISYLILRTFIGNMLITYFRDTIRFVSYNGYEVEFSTIDFNALLFSFIIFGALSGFLILFRKGVELKEDNDSIV